MDILLFAKEKKKSENHKGKKSKKIDMEKELIKNFEKLNKNIKEEYEDNFDIGEEMKFENDGIFAEENLMMNLKGFSKEKLNLEEFEIFKKEKDFPIDYFQKDFEEEFTEIMRKGLDENFSKFCQTVATRKNKMNFVRIDKKILVEQKFLDIQKNIRNLNFIQFLEDIKFCNNNVFFLELWNKIQKKDINSKLRSFGNYHKL
jgi:hypothetical protein